MFFFVLQAELLQSSEREKQTIRQQLTRKEAELIRAEETIRREQQQIQEMRHSPSLPPFFPPFLPLSLFVSQKFVSYTCLVNGPGLKSATVNHLTHILVELSGSPCTLQQNVTAQLELISQATPTNQSRLSHKTTLAVAMTTLSQYKVSYAAVSRGQHKLYVQVNDSEINGSPFTMTVYPDPTQLGQPVRVVTNSSRPYGIAYNSLGDMIISETGGHRVSVFDNRGQKFRTNGACGDSPDQMKYPKGLAIDDMDNVYVSSQHKLQKFTRNGQLIKCVGQIFNDPHGVTLHDNQVYMCDSANHRILVFDLYLNFVRSIGSLGKGRGEFEAPHDVKFDAAGNMYVADFYKSIVQVLDQSGAFIREFGREQVRKLGRPSGLYVADKYVYVSDWNGDCIVVYETSGQFVTSFGRHGQKEGEFKGPFCITSCVDGFIHVCDFGNNRVQIF